MGKAAYNSTEGDLPCPEMGRLHLGTALGSCQSDEGPWKNS